MSTRDMDIDPDFGEFEFKNDDLLLIQQTEEIYLSTQQSQRSPPPTQQVNWNQMQQKTRRSNVEEPEPELQLIESNIESMSAQNNTDSNIVRFDPEANRIIESLQFQIERLRLNAENNNDQQRNTEILQLKGMLRDKERDIIQLKKELYKFKEQASDTQQKRAFPGVNIYDKPKTKRLSTKPSPFAQAAASFSASSSRATTPGFVSSQTSSQSINIPRETPNANMPKLASLASPMMPPLPHTPSDIINSRGSASVAVEEASQIPVSQITASQASATQKKPKSVLGEPTSSTQKKKAKAASKSFPKPTEAEQNNILLIVIFTPIFQRWNIKYHENKKEINTSLTRSLIKQFSQQFSEQFVPDPSKCSSQDYERLQLLASDINLYLAKSESAKATIRILLNIFNWSLKICIKNKLYSIIHNIINTINALAASFSITRQYLHRDITSDENSLIAQCANSLSLFPFHEERCSRLLADYPNISQMKLKEIHQIAARYEVSLMQIQKDVHTPKTTNESIAIVESILELFNHVGSECSGPAFSFLLTNEHFLNLLHPQRPYTIITSALHVLETAFNDTGSKISYQDESLKGVICLISLIEEFSTSLKLTKWYTLATKVVNLLYSLLMADIPDKLAVKLNCLIFEKVKDAMDTMAAKFDKLQEHSVNEIRNQRDNYINVSLETIYITIRICPQDIFALPSNVKSIMELVNFYQSKVTTDHLLNTILASIKSSTDSYLNARRSRKKR